MKAITVYQPYAQLIALGIKSFETRPYKTNIRGRIAVHAAASVPRRFLLGFVEAVMNLRSRGEISSTEYAFLNGLTENTHGAVIGTVELCGCVPVESIRDTISASERAFGDYSDGRWAWELKRAQLF